MAHRVLVNVAIGGNDEHRKISVDGAWRAWDMFA